MIRYKKIIITLVALLAVTGAWADETLLLTIESKDYKSFKSGSMTFDDKVTVTFSNSVYNDGDTDGWWSNVTPSLLTVAGINGCTITSCKFYTDQYIAANGYTVEGESPSVYLHGAQVYTDDSKSVRIGSAGITKIEVYGAAPATEWPLTSQDGKTWTLAKMPANNIELQVEYYAESNLFLGKEALKDKANISVLNGSTAVTFDDEGKSTTTVTEGNTVTVTYTGSKKVIGVKAEKKAPAVTVTWNYDDITGTGKSFTKDGVTITAGNIDFSQKNFMQGGTFTTTLGNFTKIEVSGGNCTASGEGWSGDNTKKTWTGNASSVSFSGKIHGNGEGTLKFVFTIEPTN